VSAAPIKKSGQVGSLPAALVALSGPGNGSKCLGASDIKAASRAVLETPDNSALPYRITAFLASGILPRLSG